MRDRVEPTDVSITAMAPGDWTAVSAIYRAGIETGQATFETEPPSWEAFDTGKLTAPRLVARRDGCVVGWVAVAPVSARHVYAGVVEHSLFVDPVHQGRGVGGRLLAALLTDADQLGIWTIQANVFPRTSPAFTCTHGSASARSGPAGSWAGWRSGRSPVSGGTWC